MLSFPNVPGKTSMRNSSQPLRLIHCSNEIGEGGGIATINRYFNRFLNRDLFDPIFIATTDKDAAGVGYAETAPYHFTTMENRFDVLMQQFSTADIVQFFGGIDPVVCEAARIAKVPVLVELIHNMEPGQLYDSIDVSICVSKQVYARQPKPEKALLIPNGIDLDIFVFPEQPGQKQKFILLEAGRRDKEVHFHLDELAGELLQANPNIELWLAGSGHDLPSSERIQYLGCRSDMPDIYKEADLLINLSRNESFGLVAIEAMASGCLVVGSDDGGMSEFISEGYNGWLVDGNNRASVLSTINDAIRTRQTPKWNTMRFAARQTVEEQFDIRRWIRRHEAIYLDLIKKKKRRLTPGPEVASGPPEVFLANALFRTIWKHWPQVNNALCQLSQSTDPLKHQFLSEVIAPIIAQNLIANNRKDLAGIIYRKLFSSGFKNTDWMAEWMTLICDS